MSDLIRREDALKAVDVWESDWIAIDSAIRALPAVQPKPTMQDEADAQLRWIAEGHKAVEDAVIGGLGVVRIAPEDFFKASEARPSATTAVQPEVRQKMKCFRCGGSGERQTDYMPFTCGRCNRTGLLNEDDPCVQKAVHPDTREAALREAAGAAWAVEGGDRWTRSAAQVAILALIDKPATKGGDWPEDAAHENGNYTNLCYACTKTFVGHKRRVLCKACATKGGQ